MKIKFLFLLALISLTANAKDKESGGAGNGGDVVSCPQKELVVLDFYETLMVRASEGRPNLVIYVEQLSSEDFKQLLVDRLNSTGKIGKKLSEKLLKAWQELGAVDEWHERDINEIDDSKENYTFSDGCKSIQAVNRFGKRIEIDPDIKGKLSPGQKNVLRAHEVIYFIGTNNYKHRYSINTRKLMRELLKEEINMDSLKMAISSFIENDETSYSDLILYSRRFSGDYTGVSVDGVKMLHGLSGSEYKNCPTYLSIRSIGREVGLSINMKYPQSPNVSISRAGKEYDIFYGTQTSVHKNMLGEVKLYSKSGQEQWELSFDDKKTVGSYGFLILKSSATKGVECRFMRDIE